MSQNTYAEGKAAYAAAPIDQRPSLVRAAWDIVQAHFASDLANDLNLVYFANGTLMAAAQAIDPACNCRRRCFEIIRTGFILGWFEPITT